MWMFDTICYIRGLYSYMRGLIVCVIWAHPIQTRCANLWDLQNSSAFAYLAELLEERVASRALRSSSHTAQLVVPRTRNLWGTRSYSSAAPCVWNSLPRSIRECTTLPMFKSQLKTFLFELTHQILKLPIFWMHLCISAYLYKNHGALQMTVTTATTIRGLCLYLKYLKVCVI